MAIDRLLDECAYIKKNSLKTMNNIQDRESRLEEMINSLKREKWNKRMLQRHWTVDRKTA